MNSNQIDEKIDEILRDSEDLRFQRELRELIIRGLVALVAILIFEAGQSYGSGANPKHEVFVDDSIRQFQDSAD